MDFLITLPAYLIVFALGTSVSVKFSPDGKQLLSGSYDQTVKLWETQSQT